MKIRIPVVYEEGSYKIVYPEDSTLFTHGKIIDGDLICEYSGSKEYTLYTEKVFGEASMSALAFMDLVGDANMVSLLTLAKTDPVVELMVKKIDRADIIDFDDTERGPQKGLMYLLSIGALSRSEYDRIMRREYT